MSFAENTGYLPSSISDLMNLVREGVNEQFDTTYDEETFLGTGFYKYFYALIQRLQLNEVKTSEIFLRMQEYFDITNEDLRRPNTTAPGLLDIFEEAGYLISIKPPENGDAGKIYICADVDDGADDYDDQKLEICTMIKNSVAAGIVSQGSEVETITIENGQSFDFKFNLPDRQRTYLKLTIALSNNNTYTIGSDDSVKAALLANIAARYRLGLDFEPMRYFSILDAPWAASILLEWSDDGISYSDDPAELDYDELFECALADVTVIQA